MSNKIKYNLKKKLFNFVLIHFRIYAKGHKKVKI